MEHLDFEPYFESDANKYYDSKYIVTILENILGNKLDDIKNEINNTQIVVTKGQITEYLEKKLEEEDPELKKRIQKRKLDSQKSIKNRKNNFEDEKDEGISFKNYGPLTDKEMKELSQVFVDDLAIIKYQFDPYTLEYFKRYSNIVRNKALLLISIIEKIGNRDCMSIQDLISELDIQLDENGNVLKEDIIRLITPTVYNISALNEKITEANDLSTYLTFKISKHSLYRGGFSESEIYPSKSLQIKKLDYDYIKGNVPLSNNQKAELKDQQRRSMKKMVKMLLDW